MIDVLEQQIEAACKELFDIEITAELTRPEEQFGDYATNVALQLSKQLGKSPREISETLAVKLHERLGEQISKLTVAGPGFINLKLSDGELLRNLATEPARSLEGRIVVAEYSDPNPFKVLHAGHLYTTIAGDAISRLMEAAGATVHRLNYGGDVGLHVAKAMWAITRELGGENSENLEKLRAIDGAGRLEWLSERYVEGNKAYEDDNTSKAEIIAINRRVYELHTSNDHESGFAQIYWTCRTWSYDGFRRFYEQLEIKQFERFVPESEVTTVGIETVQQGQREGVFVESDGAVVFRGEDHGLHTRVFMNSGGLPTYEAKELGLAAMKWQKYHFDLSVIITDNTIVEYMRVVQKALASFHPEAVSRTRHFTHGSIKLPGGLKMSSRKGNILRAIDILDAARQANKQLTGEAEASEQTVLGAVKYAFLKGRMGGDVIYNPKESVSLEGNSGPYLQYAHARARSILAKADATSDLPDSTQLEAGERSLVRKMTEYSEVVNKSVDELMPHHICSYLYELAQTFNRFYEQSRVIGDERQTLRLNLVRKYADTLQAGLGLLGIAAPDRM